MPGARILDGYISMAASASLREANVVAEEILTRRLGDRENWLARIDLPREPVVDYLLPVLSSTPTQHIPEVTTSRAPSWFTSAAAMPYPRAE